MPDARRGKRPRIDAGERAFSEKNACPAVVGQENATPAAREKRRTKGTWARLTRERGRDVPPVPLRRGSLLQTRAEGGCRVKNARPYCGRDPVARKAVRLVCHLYPQGA